MGNSGLQFTSINHIARRKLGLDIVEYCVADSIYHLGNWPDNPEPGWCTASKEYIGEFIGKSGRQVFRIVDKLEKKLLVDRDMNGNLRATRLWYDEVVKIAEEHKRMRRIIRQKTGDEAKG